MRMLFTLLILLTAFSSMAFAEFNATILSYDQLTRLTPAKREAYLIQYRKVLMILEEGQRKTGIFEAKRGDEFSEQVAMMMNSFAFAPQAEAEDGQPAFTLAPPKIPILRDGGLDCSSYNTGNNQYKYDRQIGTCIVAYKKFGFYPSTNFSKNTCPEQSDTFEGSISVPSPDGGGKQVCIPFSSYNAMSVQRKEDVYAGKLLSKQEANLDLVRAGINESAKEKSVEGSKEQSAKGSKDQSADPAFNDRYPKDIKTINGASAIVPEGFTKQPANGKADEPKPEVGALGEDNCKEPDNRTCKPNPNELESVKNFRGDLASESDSCVVAGSFMTYRNPNPRKNEGSCEVPHQFPPKPAKAAAKCGAGSAMCNPFLFCATHAKDGMVGKLPVKAGDLMFHCEPVGGKAGTNVTNRCDKWREGTTGSDTSRGKKCDPTSVALKAQSGLSDATLKNLWDLEKAKFKNNFKKRCMDKAANEKSSGQGYQDLFCEECNVMKKIIYKMNKDAIDYGCASKPDPAAAAASAATPPAGTPAAPRVPPKGSAESTR